MIPINYHHLYYFWVTVKAGSINAARERLLLAQPTLSLQIRQLEQSLGKKLLHRSRSGIALTPQGALVFEHCERIFTQGEALVSALTGPEASQPVLRLGAATALPREIILRILDEVSGHQPGLQTAIVTATALELQERLGRHTLDLAVSETDIASRLGRGFHCRLVGSIPVRFVAARRLKATLGRFPSPGRELRMLFRTPDNPVRKEVESYLQRHRQRVSVAAETEDSDLIRILAIQGKGVAALNALAIEKDLEEGRLSLLQKGPTGIKEHVWFSASAALEEKGALAGILRRLLFGFEIRA